MTYKTIKYIGLGMLFNVLCITSVFAKELRLGSPFQEHMVLQQHMPITIWGEATINSLITITVDHKTINVKSDNNGNWKAVFPAHDAGGPYGFLVRSGSKKIEFNDVMFGEVWICSGQSNMFMGYGKTPEIKALDSLSKNIRTFTVKNTVAFTEQNYLNGKWELENPKSAVAFSFAYFLQKSINVPVGIILTSWGSSSIEGWMPRDMVTKLPHFKSIINDFDSDTKKKERIDSILSKQGKRLRKDDIFIRTQPNIIYNAMMKPLIPYTCRGMIWYQGEANAKNVEDMLQYGVTLPLWVNRLRTGWENNNLSFLGVMLPGFGWNLNKMNNATSLIESPEVNSWAWIRESQCKVLDLPNTGIVTTIDLGEQNNIHPKDKLPIGKRLALLAEKKIFNKDIIAEGPSVKSVSVKKNLIVVKLNQAQGLTTNDGNDPKAFWLSDGSGKWYPAEAKIKGKTIHLSSTELKKPLFVRYAFAAMPKVNLVNGAGLPTCPFRTDNFPPINTKNSNN